MSYFDKILSKSYAPIWLIFSIDIAICTFSIILAYLLRFNFQISYFDFSDLFYVIPVILVIRMLSFKIGRSYSGILRYASTADALRIFFTVSGGTVFIAVLNSVFLLFANQIILPYSIIIIDFIITLLLMTSFRVFVKIVYSKIKFNNTPVKKEIAIFGAGRSGLITKRALDQDGQTFVKIIAFLDDDPQKSGKFLEGVPIIHIGFKNQLETFFNNNTIEELIISIQDLPAIRKREIVDICLKNHVYIKVIPPVNKWINGELSINQIKEINIEDLMDRAPIQIGRNKMEHQLEGKVILVTGASGSIGSEVVRQLVAFGPARLLLLDIAESPLHELEMELRDSKCNIDIDIVTLIGDVKSKNRMSRIMEDFRPEIIYHAAAYKHVPLMEAHPAESVLNNVWGTRTIADLAVEYNVEKFLMISTDKAVNPTNVMGASKRIAEIYTQSLNNHLERNSKNGEYTRFVTTRFGNVLGSNGSVIPRFKKQILCGGPITVTHPDISRYFMTIPEACQLILEAGVMGNGGEIYIFDMGESIKIVDLARKMIKLSGLIPDRDIKVVFTGLRPGEKIKEELLNKKENTISTYHPKIMIARVQDYPYGFISGQVDDLIELAKRYDAESIVKKMKTIVPEYKSNNSVYENLDSVKAQ